MKHLFNMNMSEGGFVADHLTEFNTVTSQLSYVGVTLMMKLELYYSFAHCQKVGMV